MSIIYTILIFGIIIFIHELGHFIVAKLSKITVYEFSLGMGPTIFKYQSKKRQKDDIVEIDGEDINTSTKYSLRLLPIGGYVAMGEDDELTDNKNSFNSKPIWKRMAVILAGAAMNLLLGFIIMLCIYSTQPVYNSATVAEFMPDATTQASGLQVGDKIVKMNKTTVFNDRDIVFEMMRDPDSLIDVKVLRDGEKVLLPQVKFNTKGEGASRELIIDFKVVGVKRTVFSAIDYTFRNTVSLARNSWSSIGDLFTGTVKVSDLSGPVGVGQVVDQATGIGFEAVMLLAAFITISVGMFNLLPFPALDGGRFVLLILEAIRKKPINRKVETAINGIGLMLLFGLMILVTFKDIVKLF